MISSVFSLANLSFVYLICKPPRTKPKRVERCFFLPDTFIHSSVQFCLQEIVLVFSLFLHVCVFSLRILWYLLEEGTTFPQGLSYGSYTHTHTHTHHPLTETLREGFKYKVFLGERIPLGKWGNETEKKGSYHICYWISYRCGQLGLSPAGTWENCVEHTLELSHPGDEEMGFYPLPLSHH